MTTQQGQPLRSILRRTRTEPHESQTPPNATNQPETPSHKDSSSNDLSQSTAKHNHRDELNDESQDCETNGVHWTESAFGVFLSGVTDACGVHHALALLLRSATVRKKALQCLILNGVLFLGSILLFDYVVRPFSVAWIGSSDYHGEGAAFLAAFVNVLILTVQYIFWLVPVYGISFVLNNIWYQDIATIAYRSRYEKLPSVSVNAGLISDEIFRTFLLPCYALQVLILYLIPFVGPAFSLVFFSWLCSFYSFDYKWAIKGAPLVNRIRYFEEHWAYMAGFGAPCAIATFFTNTFISSGTYAIIFPVLIIIANCAKPKKHSSRDIFSLRLPIFQFSKVVTDRLIVYINRRAVQ